MNNHEEENECESTVDKSTSVVLFYRNIFIVVFKPFLTYMRPKTIQLVFVASLLSTLH